MRKKKKTNKTATLIVRLTPERLKALNKTARKLGITKSEVVRRLIKLTGLYLQFVET